MQHSNLHIFFILTVSTILLFGSCEKYEKHPVPKVPVNFQINVLTDPAFIRLGAPGNSVVVTGGSIGLSDLGYDGNGILLYNAGNDEFYAFDRTCPHDMPVSVAVEDESGTGMATCPECGTTYVMPGEGQPTVDGPGKWPLQRYRAYYYPSTGLLQVSN